MMRVSTVCARGFWVVPLLVLIASSAAASSLAEAARKQNKGAVRTLLKQPSIDVNAPQADGATALHWAAHWDDLETVNLLVGARANVNVANDYGVTPLALAVENRNAAIVEVLLKAGANPNAAHVTGETVLMTAAWTGSVQVAKQLLEAGSEVNAKERSEGQTALMWAVAERHADVTRVLVEHGADVTARSVKGFTPLLFAARMGDLESARILLAAGADVNEAMPDGPSALVVATVRGHVPLAIFLLERGADPNQDGGGYTAMHWAAGSWETRLTGNNGLVLRSSDDPLFSEWDALRGLRTGKLDLIKALLAHGANPNARLVKEPPRAGNTSTRLESRVLTGATPFLLAAAAGDVAAMGMLAAAGADPTLATTARGSDEEDTVDSFQAGHGGGMTPLMAAAGLGRVVGETLVTAEMAFEASKLALELGNDINATNDYGETALHGAAHIRNNKLVQFLVDKGAHMNARTTRVFNMGYGPAGQTPTMYAERIIAPGSLPVHERTNTGDLLRKLGGE